MNSTQTPDADPRSLAQGNYELPEILEGTQTRVAFGPGRLGELGELARGEEASRVLVVTDPGIVAAGHVQRAVSSLLGAGLFVAVFDGVEENPTTRHVKAGVILAEAVRPDLIVGLGGGSAMDCAKGINFILTNGGEIVDYWGFGKATEPMLPMIAVPTTAGTGSDAQSFALITDPVTRRKMACGDTKARCRAVVLDPDLTLTVPPQVAAAAGIDAIAHTVETAGTTKRSEVSLAFTMEAWQRLSRAFEPALRDPQDDSARAAMLLGAHLAGAAIERSMLGAAHACANPLTARFPMAHGAAVGLMLPHVVRFNARHETLGNPYAALGHDAEELARLLTRMLNAARLQATLQGCGVPEDALPDLAREAAGEWTVGFNPRRLSECDLLAIYRDAYV